MNARDDRSRLHRGNHQGAAGGLGVHGGWGIAGALASLVLVLLILPAQVADAQQLVSPKQLQELRQQAAGERAVAGDLGELSATPASDVRVATLSAPAGPFANPLGVRAGTPLYTGLQPSGLNAFWSFGQISGSSYWVLDDGVMGLPAAVVAGGGHVTDYAFSFSVTPDNAGDTIAPAIIVTFWNAPPDPVADATDPVVDPPAPVSSVLWYLDPVTPVPPGTPGPLPTVTYVLGPIDLTVYGLGFDLDDSFYFEILPFKYDSNLNLIMDPNIHASFNDTPTITLGANQDVMWSDAFPFTGSPSDGLYAHPGELFGPNPFGSPYGSHVGINLFGQPCPGVPQLRLDIDEPADICVQPGEPVTVTMAMSCLPEPIRGYQAFLDFDPAALIFDSGSYMLPNPFGLPVIAPIAAVGPDIDLAAGINDPAGQPLATGSANLAVLNFTAGATEGFTDVGFRTNNPPTRFSNALGQSIIPDTMDTPLILVDGTPPTFTCPPPGAKAECDGSVDPSITGEPTNVTDNFDTAPVVSYTDDASDLTGCNGTGFLHRTWTVTDCAGNEASCVQEIEITDTIDPVLTIPGDVTIECDASTDPTNTGQATATDNCDPAPVVTYSDVFTPNPACPTTGMLTRTWTAIDACSNGTSDVQTITIQDTTPPTLTAVPPDVTISCDDSRVPSIPFGVANGGIAIYYNSTGGEDPANQAFIKVQIDGANDPTGGVAGAPFLFDSSPLTGGPYVLTWQEIYSGLPVGQSQFGFDLVLPMPTNDGSVLPPVLNAYENTDNTVAGRMLVGPVTWAFDDYKPHTPDISAGTVIHSSIRSAMPANPAVDVQITQMDLSLSGTIYTLEIAGKLVSDGINHWYTLTTPDSSMSNFNLSGEFYFFGTLTYDSAGDPGTDLIDFYEGPVTIVANSPTTQLGFALATDNCDLFPVVSYSDDESGLTGCNGTGIIVRTWTATDCAGNSVSADQTITVVDNTPPTIDVPASDLTVECDGAGNVGDLTAWLNSQGGAVASDTCGGVTWGNDFAALSDGCGETGSATVIFTATDGCGNAATTTATFTIEDTTAPVIDCTPGGGLIISEVVDGTLSGGVPKWVEITNTSSNPVDLSGYSLGHINNGATALGNNAYVLSGILAAGDSYVVSYESSDGPGVGRFFDVYGFDPDNFDPSAFINGDDQLVLFQGAALAGDPADGSVATVVDYFGVNGVNGDGEFWDYTDGYAYRLPAYVTGQAVMVEAEWFFGGLASLEGPNDAARIAAMLALTTPGTHAFTASVGCGPIEVHADAGGCTAAASTVNAIAPSATDDCGPATVAFLSRSDGMSAGDPYPGGTTTITWEATDDCGNTSTATQDVIVSGFNELVVDVQLSPSIAAASLTRCITFELWNCPSAAPAQVVNQDITFTNGLATGVVVEVPCGAYTCITARDKLHTLRRTDETFAISGTQYTADFTGNPTGGGDWLIGGNLNDDYVIDILDFGVFSANFASTYGTVDTTCGTPYPHADINGSGSVQSDDYTFVQINFLNFAEANCCGAAGLRDGEGIEPVLAIAVAELHQRGLSELAVADLNGDGMLDQADVAAFMMGARPTPPAPAPTPVIKKKRSQQMRSDVPERTLRR